HKFNRFSLEFRSARSATDPQDVTILTCKGRGNWQFAKSLRITVTLPAIPYVVMAADGSDESNLGGVAAIGGWSMDKQGPRCVQPSKIRCQLAPPGGPALAGRGRTGRGSEHAARLVAALHDVRPPRLATLFRFSHLGSILLLPPCAACLGLRSV